MPRVCSFLKDNLINNGYNYEIEGDVFTKEIDNRIIKCYHKSSFLSFREINDQSIVIINYFGKQKRWKIEEHDLEGNVIEKLDYIGNVTNNKYIEEINLLERELLLIGSK